MLSNSITGDNGLSKNIIAYYNTTKGIVRLMLLVLLSLLLIDNTFSQTSSQYTEEEMVSDSFDFAIELENDYRINTSINSNDYFLDALSIDNPSSSIEVGQEFEFTGRMQNTGTEIGTYRAKIVIEKFEGINEVVVDEFRTAATEFQPDQIMRFTPEWTPEEPGRYRAVLLTYNFDWSVQYDVEYSSLFDVSEVFEVTGVEIEVNRTSVDPNQEYRLSGTVYGTGEGEVTYRYQEKDQSNSWNTIETGTLNYSGSSKSVPSFDVQRYLAGTYEYRVQITEPNSDASASVNVTVAEVFDAEVGAIQVSNNREVGLSQEVIISAENTGNVTGTFRFKFEVQKRNAVGIFSTVDGFTQTENREIEWGVTGSETFYWTPEEAGTYRIKASIQNFDGSATYDDANSDNFEIIGDISAPSVEVLRLKQVDGPKIQVYAKIIDENNIDLNATEFIVRRVDDGLFTNDQKSYEFSKVEGLDDIYVSIAENPQWFQENFQIGTEIVWKIKAIDEFGNEYLYPANNELGTGLFDRELELNSDGWAYRIKIVEGGQALPKTFVEERGIVDGPFSYKVVDNDIHINNNTATWFSLDIQPNSVQNNIRDIEEYLFINEIFPVPKSGVVPLSFASAFGDRSLVIENAFDYESISITSDKSTLPAVIRNTVDLFMPVLEALAPGLPANEAQEIFEDVFEPILTANEFLSEDDPNELALKILDFVLSETFTTTLKEITKQKLIDLYTEEMSSAAAEQLATEKAGELVGTALAIVTGINNRLQFVIDEFKFPFDNYGIDLIKTDGFKIKYLTVPGYTGGAEIKPYLTEEFETYLELIMPAALIQPYFSVFADINIYGTNGESIVESSQIIYNDEVIKDGDYVVNLVNGEEVYAQGTYITPELISGGDYVLPLQLEYDFNTSSKGYVFNSNRDPYFYEIVLYEGGMPEYEIFPEEYSELFKTEKIPFFLYDRLNNTIPSITELEEVRSLYRHFFTFDIETWEEDITQIEMCFGYSESSLNNCKTLDLNGTSSIILENKFSENEDKIYYKFSTVDLSENKSDYSEIYEFDIQVEDQSLEILAPDNENIVYEIGEEIGIVWSSNRVEDNISLELVNSDGLVIEIGEWPVTQNFVEWVIPDEVSSSNDYRVRIYSKSNNDIYDESDNTFSIINASDPSLTVLSPIGGEEWSTGAEYIIEWDAVSLGGEATIKLLKSDEDLLDISVVDINDEEFNWLIPDNLETNNDYAIKIISLENSAVTDQSDQFFNITQAVETYSVSVTVTPEGSGTINGAGSFDDQSEITLEAIANSGYEFSYWSEDNENIGDQNPYSFILNQDRDLVAFFELNPTEDEIEVVFSGNLEGDVGTPDVLIPVEISSSEEKLLQSFEFEMSYDPSVLLFKDIQTTGTLIESEFVEANFNETGTIRISSAAQTSFSSNGTLIYLVADLLEVGFSVLNWDSFFFNEGQPVAITSDNIFEVKEVIVPPNRPCGDVTRDFTISNADATHILRHVVKLLPEYPISESDSAYADVTSNSWISAFDASQILKKIVNENHPLDCGILPTKLAYSETNAIVEWRLNSDLSSKRFQIPISIAEFENLESIDLEINSSEGLKFNSISNLPENWLVEYNAIEDKLLISMLVNENDQYIEPLNLIFDVTDADDANLKGRARLNENQVQVLTDLNVIEKPSDFKLSQNYPNPFNPSTLINYSVPEISDVRIVVFNALGQQVSELVNTVHQPGNYSVQFEAGGLSSGIYIYRLITNNQTITKKHVAHKVVHVSYLHRISSLLILSVCLCLSFRGMVNAQVSISLPDTLLSDTESSYLMDIVLSDVQTESVSGFTFVIEYDPTIIFIDTYTKTSLTSGFFVQDNNTETGIYRITAANSTPIEENGILIQLNVDILNRGETYLIFNQASINEGDPAVIPVNGNLVIWNESLAPETLNPVNNTTDSDTSLVLSWEPNPFYNLYEVHFSEDENFNPTLVYTGIQDTILNLVDLDFNTAYYWKVRGYSFFGSTPFSDASVFKTKEKPNTPPIVKSPVTDLTLNEDFGVIEVAFLDTVFTDSETSTLTYQVSSALELVNGFVENRNLFFESKQDQFGLDTLFIQALDDGDFEVIDSIIVDVLPINDPPEIINAFPEFLQFREDSKSQLLFISDYISDVDNELADLSLKHVQVPVFMEYNFHAQADEFTISVSDTMKNEFFSFSISDGVDTTEQIDIEIRVDITNSEFNSDGVSEFKLSQNYPNPFNPFTNISFELAEAQSVQLIVFDISGREVVRLVDRFLLTGSHTYTLDASNLSTGVYFFQLVTSTYSETKKMLLIK